LIKNIIFITTIAALLSSCSDDVSNNSVPESDYYGVSEYNERGSKIADADNDWIPECYEIIAFEDNHICFFSIYPLPAADTITVFLTSIINGEINVWLSLTEETIEKNIYKGNIQETGKKIKISFDENLLYRNVVYRLFVETTDTATGETRLHYGDVLWKNK
jgi:hypothetical protein